MNNGMKIILIMGIAASVVFAANFFAGLYAHQKIADYHKERFETMQKTAVTGSDWNKAKEILKEENYTLKEVPLEDGALRVTCSWDAPENKAHVQDTELNIVVYAVISVDAAGKIVSVSGEK